MTSTTQSRRTATKKKIIASAAVLAGVAGLAGMGAYAVFTDSGTATAALDAGELDIVMSESFTVADIAPSDTVQRPINITLPAETNDGDLVAAVRFFYDVTTDVAGTDDTALDGPGESLVTGVDGLSYRLVTCNGAAWVAAAPPAAQGPYTCAGTQTVTSQGKLSTIGGVANAVDLGPAAFGVDPTATNTFPTDAGDVALNSLIEFTLPASADNDYENAATSLAFTGAAIQRSGIQK